MKRTAILLVVAVVAGLFTSLASPASARVVRRTTISCNGCWPTAFAFTPSGKRLFFVERFSGRIRSYRFTTGKASVWGRIPGVATSGEQGLLGLAVHPQWPSKKFLYLYYTNASPFQNRIVRLKWQPDGTPRRTVLLRIRAAGNHNGGVIHFGPDGMLYAVTGDAVDPARSQNTASNAGKVLRMTRGGRVPGDNPFPGEYGYSYGHRNSFGFTFDPQTGRLWQTENGPACDDEVNLVRAGANYGWGPASACPGTSESGPNPVQPETTWNPVVAPTGATFCDGCRLGSRARGRLIVGAWNDGKIRRLTLDAQRNDIRGRRLLWDNPQGVLAVETRPTKGRIFFSDPNGIYRLVRV